MKIKFLYLNIWQSTPELKRLLDDGIICYARGEDYSEFYYLEKNEQFIKNELLKSINKYDIEMVNIKEAVTVCEFKRISKELGLFTR